MAPSADPVKGNWRAQFFAPFGVSSPFRIRGRARRSLGFPVSNFALLLFVLVGLGTFVGGVVLALVALRGAPDGFEDQEGFHAGSEPGARVPRVAIPPGKKLL